MTNRPKVIYTEDGRRIEVAHINAYLMDAPDVFLSLRSAPLWDVPRMVNGNVPLDGDALKVEEADLADFADCPFVKRLIGGRELLHGDKRYVLWLVGVSPHEIHRFPKVLARVALCRERRLAMKDAATRRLAATPTTFRDTNNPADYIALPMVSSERREYLPMAYLHGDTIPTNQVQTIPGATLYHFGVLSSSVHMAWMRAVCGRLETRYRYSAGIVYNNFPWPEGGGDFNAEAQSRRETQSESKNLCEPQRLCDSALKITQTAQAILDARARYPDSSLADLYDPLTMPSDLRAAHVANDAAVLAAYGWGGAPGVRALPESEIVSRLFNLYAEKIDKTSSLQKFYKRITSL